MYHFFLVRNICLLGWQICIIFDLSDLATLFCKALSMH